MTLASVSELWIKTGLFDYLTDLFYLIISNNEEYKISIYKKFEKMLWLIKNGRELSPIG